jgi:hypothetical protein
MTLAAKYHRCVHDFLCKNSGQKIHNHRVSELQIRTSSLTKFL